MGFIGLTASREEKDVYVCDFYHNIGRGHGGERRPSLNSGEGMPAIASADKGRSYVRDKTSGNIIFIGGCFPDPEIWLMKTIAMTDLKPSIAPPNRSQQDVENYRPSFIGMCSLESVRIWWNNESKSQAIVTKCGSWSVLACQS